MNFRLRPALCVILTMMAFAPALPAATPGHVVVEAGDFDRTNALASFPWPRTNGTLVLRDARTPSIPVQLADGRAWFIEPGLARHTTRRYRIEAGPDRELKSRVAAVRTGDVVELRLDGNPVVDYLAGHGHLPRPDIPPEFLRGGYLHPLRTPSGRIVTDDYATNHVHHHGIWFSWTRTEFGGRAPDFWNMGDRKGRTDFAAFEGSAAGPAFAEVRARHVFTDLLAAPPVAVLNEHWKVRLLAFGGRGAFHAFDVESTQDCAGPEPLRLPKYHYGGFAWRGPSAWNGPQGVRYLDSNGQTNRVAANESRVRWHWIGGPVDGALAGVAFLGHPENFRAPQPVRVHPTEPYTCWTPSQLGDWEIQPGKPYRSSYRVVALDGEPDPALLDRLWNDFASPPLTRVE